MSSENVWDKGLVSRFRLDGNMGSPFHQRTSALATTNWYFNWDLRMVPDEFVDFAEEVKAVRENVAMADMSPLTKIQITGKDATAAVNWLVTRDINKMEVRQVLFTPLCTEEGKVITDGLVFREEKNKYRITADPMFEWVYENCKKFDVEVEDVTDDFGILTLQGPKSINVLEDVTSTTWKDLDFSRLVRSKIAGVDVEIGRTGFTGELGYEILVKSIDANAIWDAVEQAGKPYGIIPAGQYALDILRIEAGLLITGCDYTNAGPDPSGSHCKASSHPDRLASPFEVNMGALVDLSKDDFIGKSALVKEKKNGTKVQMRGVEIDWHSVVDLYVRQGIAPQISPKADWEGSDIFIDDEHVGWISSTVWSTTLKKLIAFAHIKTKNADIGNNVEINWQIKGGQDGKVRGEITKLPFVDHKRES